MGVDREHVPMLFRAQYQFMWTRRLIIAFFLSLIECVFVLCVFSV